MRRDVARATKKSSFPEIAEPLERAAALHEFSETIHLGIELMKMFQDAAEKAGLFRHRRTFVITIRPKPGLTFDAFKNRVEHMMRRECFIAYAYSYEQKGTDPDNLGNGFHVHIVASVTQRSKGELLRDLQSTWNGVVDAQCIQVDACFTSPKTFVEHYLIHYKSNDGHKILTRDADASWRASLSLPAVVVSADDPWGLQCLPSSPLAGCSKPKKD